MKGFSIIGGILLVLLTSGCNSDSESSSSASGPSSSSESFIGNGIYKGDGNDFMLVDSTRANNNVFLADLDSGEFYVVDNSTATETQMITRGLTYSDNGNISRVEDFVATANFTPDTVTITAQLEDQNFIYSMDRAEDSLPLEQIVGTHTNPDDGSTWEINEDGSFVINGSCIISGNIKRQGAYYNINSASAVSCNNSAENGSYYGALITLNIADNYYLFGIFANQASLLVTSFRQS
ncbi:hypothetical protein [Photobacterium lipolyticum]|uniref:Uncharacterized protein n=1 Tax=Photobacterium lipolyticum TaxID=266810 RepID=A0A2T3N505_9GAMM|nr:hypothetical protein [Photobacterium lipolyticum]PSW07532.1 hypothetical protein C9I89_02125 [Photobacterium lipolyticum]